MLSRVASQLYWMARHIERAENTARTLDVTHRMSLLPYRVMKQGESWAEPWAVPLVTNGLVVAYYKRHPGPLDAVNVLRFMVFDPQNPSSIYCCLQAAREAARSVRDAITSEMYEDLNAAWLELKVSTDQVVTGDGVSEFFERVKMRSHQFRGVTFGTMLRDEGYRFIRLGGFVERADNTARILDVKYHVLLPSVGDVGGAVDYYQWSALLRSVSAFESYRRIYRDIITPLRVAELLILRDDVPRSLHNCMNEITGILDELGDRTYNEPRRLAGELHAKLHYGRVEEVISLGLHEYLMTFLSGINRLGDEINKQFFAPS
jgi:uncharacterized alpha-E superfamily protein